MVGKLINGPVRVSLVTFLAGASAALVLFVTKPVLSFLGKADEISFYDPLTLLCSLYSGLVSISASCGNVTNESGIAIGVIGSFAFMFSKKMLLKFEIDDGLSQVSIHMVCGIWGLLAAGIYDANEGTLSTGSMRPILNQFIGICAIMLLAAISSLVFFVTFR